MSDKDWLNDNGYEDVVIFCNPTYDGCLIGVDTNGRAVYSKEKMVRFLIDTDGMSEEDARDFIDYNTVRSLPYIGTVAPIIIEAEKE